MSVKRRTVRTKSGGKRRVTRSYTQRKSGVDTSRRKATFRGKGGLKRKTSSTRTGGVSKKRRSINQVNTTSRSRNGKPRKQKRVRRTAVRSGSNRSVKRVARVKTAGGLKRTVRTVRTAAGKGAKRITRTRRSITRSRNGRTSGLSTRSKSRRKR